MPWLVDPELAPAWQRDERQEPPGLVVEPVLDGPSLGLKVRDRCVDVIAEQIELVTRLAGLVGMHRHFGGWKAKDQPAAARVHGAEPEHVRQKLAIGVGIMAVDDCVSPVDHLRLLRIKTPARSSRASPAARATSPESCRGTRSCHAEPPPCPDRRGAGPAPRPPRRPRAPPPAR